MADENIQKKNRKMVICDACKKPHYSDESTTITLEFTIGKDCDPSQISLSQGKTSPQLDTNNLEQVVSRALSNVIDMKMGNPPPRPERPAETETLPVASELPFQGNRPFVPDPMISPKTGKKTVLPRGMRKLPLPAGAIDLDPNSTAR